MNSFAALTLDSDDENEAPKVNNKKVTSSGPTKAAKAPVVQRNIPGMAPKKFTPSTSAVPSYEAEDPVSNKVNDRGGRNREKYNGHSSVKGATPNDSKAHKDRHDYARTGRGGGKEGSRGGRGPGGWGSVSEEARRAQKGEPEVGAGMEEALEESDGADQAPEEPPAPTVFGFEEALARREAARASSSLFSEVQERKVDAPELKQVAPKADVPERFEGKQRKGSSGPQRSTFKKSLDANFVVQSAVESAPRERPERSEGSRGGRGRGDRDSGRGGRGGRGSDRDRNSRGPSSKLREDDFPAL